MRKLVVFTMTVALLMAVAAPALAGRGPPPRDEDGDRVRVVVYVESQGLFYDSIVGPALPAIRTALNVPAGTVIVSIASTRYAVFSAFCRPVLTVRRTVLEVQRLPTEAGHL